NVGQKVDGMIAQNNQQHQETQQGIERDGNEIRKQNSDLEKHHNTEGNKFENEYNERASVVKSLPGADSPRELEAKAAKIQKDYIDGKR
ncbi:TPA: hypothetical protein GM643_26380, partial [Klebsiella pneumoniae]|nr:hypothetical protein [Klebsiella pneumoniae]